MAKRALIAEPDIDEARKQGAILADDGYEVEIFAGGDLLEELEAVGPDVLVLRHERPGQNGLALVQRIKRNQKFGGTAVVITTSDLPPEGIERHKEQANRADAYVRLPLDRKALIEAAHSLPEVLEADDAEVEVTAEGEPVADSTPKPPPLRRGRPPPRRMSPGSRSGEGMPVLETGDLGFFDDMFASIQEVDADAPAQADIPIPKSGPDRKLALLRAKLREYEHKMGRLKVEWKHREDKFRDAQAIVEQKAMEVEGLNLKIKELDEELGDTRDELKKREAEFGRTLGEQWDERSLQEAELIQVVSGKESEINKLKRKHRKLEEEKEKVEKDLSERIYEWERAYKRFEEHHWQVIDASGAELERLQSAIEMRAERHRELMGRHRDVTASLELERMRHDETRRDLWAAQHARDEELLRVGGMWEQRWHLERSLRVALQDEKALLDLAVLDLEDALNKHARLLSYLEGERQAQLNEVAGLEREARAALTDANLQLRAARDETGELERTLSTERAYGETAINKLLTDGQRDRSIARAEIELRDDLIQESSDENERLTGTLQEVSAQLGEEEAHHAAESERADELQSTLDDVRAEAAENSEMAAHEISSLTEELTGLRGDHEEKLAALDQTRTELAEEREQRREENRDATMQLERRESELKERTARAADLERDLDSARDDIQQLRSTVGTRDERITELLAKARENDEQIVRLEAQHDRFETQVAEQRAELEAQREREQTLEQRLHEREAQVEDLGERITVLDETLRDAENAAHRADAELAETRGQLEAELAVLAQTREQLGAREGELASEREASTELGRELAEARAEIEAGAAMAEEQLSQLSALEQSARDQRAAADEHAAGLSQVIEDREQAVLEANGRTEERERALTEAHGRIEEAMGRVSDLEQVLEAARARDAELSGELGRAQQAHEETEARRADLQRLYDAIVERQQELENTLRENENARTELVTKVAGSEELVAAQERELAEVREARAESHSLVEVLKPKLDEADRLNAELDEQLSELSQTNGVLEATVVERDRSLAALDQSLAQTETALAEREQQIEALEASTREQSARAEEQNVSMRDQQVELEELRSTVGEHATAIEERGRWLEAREARIGELTGELEAAHAKTAELTARVEQAMDTANMARDQVKVMQQEFDESSATSDAQIVERANQIEQLTADVGDLQAQLAEAREQAASATSERDRLGPMEQELQTERAERAQLEEALSGLRSQAGEFSEETLGLRTQLQAVSQAQQQASSDGERLNAELSKAKEMAQKYAQAAKEANAKVDQHSKRMQDAQAMLARLTAAHDTSKQRVDELERNLAAVEETWTARLNEVQEEAETEKRRLTQEAHKAKKLAKDAILKAQQIKQQYDAFKQQRDARLKAQRDKLRAATAGTSSPAPPPAAEEPVPEPPPAPFVDLSAAASDAPPAFVDLSVSPGEPAFDPDATRVAGPGEIGAAPRGSIDSEEVPAPPAMGDAEGDDGADFDEATRVADMPTHLLGKN